MRVLVVVLLYGSYFLLGGGLTGERMPYDAGHYWELAVSMQHKHRSFSLLYFQDHVRGYFAALVQYPALIIRFLTQCSMPTAAKAAGIGWAAVLYAGLLPALWRSLAGRAVSGGRWLLLLLLAFVFWRDHFSFTMADVPAVVLLLLALWAPGRSCWGWWMVAGLALAAATNTRPMYLGAVPGAMLLAVWWNRQHVRAENRAGIAAVRWMAWLLGAALALATQWMINLRHFQHNSPLVHVRTSDAQSLPVHLQQLTWGTRVLRNDADLHQRLVYVDSAGIELLRAEGISPYFSSYSQYGRVVIRHPISFAGRYAQHVFNGLDVWHSAPYRLHAYTNWRLWLQLLNYIVLGIGGLTLLLGRPNAYKKVSWSVKWAFMALLGACAAGIPTSIECRYLLPLHLLLLCVAAWAAQPGGWGRWLRRRPIWLMMTVLAAGLWLGGCFWLSAATEHNLVPDKGPSLVD